MKKLSSFFLAIMVGILFIGCDPNDDSASGNGNNNQSDAAFRENFGNQVQRNFMGQIVDTDGNPISAATVKIGSSTDQTDANGVFLIQNAQVYEKFAYITVSKPGYANGSRTVVPTTGTSNVKIMLLQDGDLQTVQAGQASEVSIYSGTKVKFDGAFEDENGNAYTGSVGVFMFHLTPSDENLGELQPGSLYAEREDGSESILETYGMLKVELRGSAGQKLQIAEGHTAEITVRIDDSQLATAPQSIPLWHFDENAGWWKEEGFATRQGNYYVGNVAHFSWWNCDIQLPLSQLTIRVKDQSGNPITGVKVSLEALQNGLTSLTRFTNGQGEIAGMVPANYVLRLKIWNCNGVVHEEEIGPFTQWSQNEKEVQMVVPNPILVSASVRSCNGAPITSGYVLFQSVPWDFVFPVENGQVQASVSTCEQLDVYTMSFYDNYGGEFVSGEMTGDHHWDFVLVCESGQEYLSYQIDDQPLVMLTGEFDAGQNNAVPGFHVTTSSSAGALYLITNTTILGSYSTSNYTISGLITLNNSIPNDIMLNITRYMQVGQFIDATLSGTFTDQTGTHTVSGQIHVKRDY